MIVRSTQDVPASTVANGAENVTIQWLIAKPEGAANFFMRQLNLGPNGSTPHHSHDWEHEVYVLSGTGRLVGESGAYDLEQGMVALVPGGEVHHFETTRDSMSFLCLIPSQK